MTDLFEETVEIGPAKGLALLLNALAALMLFCLMLVTCTDVVGRYGFNNPLTGSTELTEMSLAIMIFAVLPVLSWRNEHIVVDIVDRFVGPKLHLVRTVFFHFIAAGGSFFIGQRIIVLGNRSLSYGEVTEYLHVPTGWVINIIGGMCWLTAGLLLTVGVLRTWRLYRFPIVQKEMSITE